MHRVRQSLSYYNRHGYEPMVLAAEASAVPMTQDSLLVNSIPKDIIIERVKPGSMNISKWLGFRSIAWRAFGQFLKGGNAMIAEHKPDLIFFSTTAFPVCLLGRYWKKKFGIPYVIDMQDPWLSVHYLDKPASQRPKRFWLGYFVDKWMEKWSMARVDGLMSVSEKYISVLKERYPQLKSIPSAVITFGAMAQDMEVADCVRGLEQLESNAEGTINVVYVGRGGHDMAPAFRQLFGALALLKKEDETIYNRLRWYFVGTDYASKDLARKTVEPITRQLGVSDYVIEITDRLPYFQALKLLLRADVLFVPGSEDLAYSASKIYPYVLANKPMFSILPIGSNMFSLLDELNSATLFHFSENEKDELSLKDYLKSLVQKELARPATDWEKFKKYSADKRTEEQCRLFDDVLKECNR